MKAAVNSENRKNAFKSSAFSLEELINIQKALSRKLVLTDEFKKINTIAGADISYHHSSNKAACAVSVFDFETMREIKTTVKKFSIDFPYIPGFLAFREAEPIAETVKSLCPEGMSDILLIDGHGIAHPRYFGVASHIGIILDIATIGVAKSLLVGKVDEGKIVYQGKTVGFALKNKNFSEIYISPGNKVSLSSSLGIVKKCMLSHRLPEPLYRAHASAVSFCSTLH